jgi:hypothetical protein
MGFVRGLVSFGRRMLGRVGRSREGVYGEEEGRKRGKGRKGGEGRAGIWEGRDVMKEFSIREVSGWSFGVGNLV